jgi:hypothetical protein
VITNVPGPPGLDADDGAAGTNGVNAFSFVDGGTTVIPDFMGTVAVPVVNPAGTQWMCVDQIIFITGAGYYKVISIADATHVTVQNLGYPGNVQGNGLLAFTSGAKISPGGLAGPMTATFGRYGLLGQGLHLALNSTADQPILVGASRYVVTDVVVTNKQGASTPDATKQGAVYNAIGKPGGGILTTLDDFNALSSATKFQSLSMTGVALTDVQTTSALQFSMTNADPNAITVDVWVFGFDLT